MTRTPWRCGENAVRSASFLYGRRAARPFVVNQQAPGTPEEQDGTGADRPYTSGHLATATVWALILAKLAPDRALAVPWRGQSYAGSRMVCSMPWPGDTIQGRFVHVDTYSR